MVGKTFIDEESLKGKEESPGVLERQINKEVILYYYGRREEERSIFSGSLKKDREGFYLRICRVP